MSRERRILRSLISTVAQASDSHTRPGPRRTRRPSQHSGIHRRGRAVRASACVEEEPSDYTHITAVVEQLRVDVRDLPKRVRCPSCEGTLSVGMISVGVLWCRSSLPMRLNYLSS